jgi:aspartyl-tRNA(Asn)/glutamyl-tRNA(Gln) amidotransferase subunit A
VTLPGRSLADLSAAELVAAYAAGAASPVDAVDACLERIEQLDPRINAISTVLADSARAAARESARRWVSGDARPLEGVPYGAKDLIMTAGVRTAGGSRLYDALVPVADATVVERMAAAGAVLVAKLHTFEFARGDDSVNGPTRNPWHLERTAGASSTGVGAALAARMLPVAIGTDTGGSIRVPATATGTTGLKPTNGRVSTFGVMPQSWTLDTVGPMARTARDCGMVLAVVAGHDPRDPSSSRAPVTDDLADADSGVTGLRIGVPTDYFFDVIDGEVRDSFDNAIELLVTAGADVLEVRLPHVHLSDAAGGAIIYAEFAALHETHFARLAELGRRYTQRELVSSQFCGATDYLRAARVLHVMQHDFQNVFDVVDALVVPGMVATAPPLDTLEFSVDGGPRSWGEVVARMTLPFNLVGAPALALPTGFGSDGLPLGLQVVAPPLREAMCIRVGVTYQERTHHHRAAPPIVEGATVSGSRDA